VNRGGSDYAHTFNADAPGVEVSLNMRIGKEGLLLLVCKHGGRRSPLYLSGMVPVNACGSAWG